MTVREVIRYETSDGKLFECDHAADVHEKNLSEQRLLDSLAEEIRLWGKWKHPAFTDNPELSHSLIRIIVENRRELVLMLARTTINSEK